MSSWPICSICCRPVESVAISVCYDCWEATHDGFDEADIEADANSVASQLTEEVPF